MNESNVSDLRPHVAHSTRLRRRPPKTRHTKLVSARAEPSGGLGRAASTHRLCIASRRHRANSCASSWRPLRNVLLTERRFFTKVTGATAGPPEPARRALQTCSPISNNASKDPPFGELVRRRWCLCSPASAYAASGGVCVKHCMTEFMKHVLPRFARPAPTFRAAGQRIVIASRG